MTNLQVAMNAYRNLNAEERIALKAWEAEEDLRYLQNRHLGKPVTSRLSNGDFRDHQHRESQQDR